MAAVRRSLPSILLGNASEAEEDSFSLSVDGGKDASSN